MPSYLVNSGIKMPMSDDLYDLLWNSLGNIDITDTETSSLTEEVEATTPVEKPMNSDWRKQDDGYYNKKPNDKDYFKKYYKTKTKNPCNCDICGALISCRSNLSKHKKTKKCKSSIV